MPYHDHAGDILAYRQFCLIADKIEADPALLEIPSLNMAVAKCFPARPRDRG